MIKMDTSFQANRRKIDWPALLRNLGVTYITEGKNTKPGALSCKCPLCGFSDPSEHLVITLKTNSWFCWRNKQHRGRDPVKLVQLIGRMSDTQARTLIEQVSEADESPQELSIKELRARATQVFRKKKAKKVVTDSQAFPDEMKPILNGKPSARRFLDHLKTNRSFNKYAKAACRRFELRYSLSGKFAHRIIIPLNKDGKLVGWTGRSIRKDARNRYETFPLGDASKRLIFNQDKAKGGRILFIVEGPIDSIKLDLFASMFGCSAVATLGTNTYPSQVPILHKLIRLHDLTVIAFDPQAEAQALHLKNELLVTGKPIRIAKMPDRVEDPGAMLPKQAKAFVKSWLKTLH